MQNKGVRITRAKRCRPRPTCSASAAAAARPLSALCLPTSSRSRSRERIRSESSVSFCPSPCTARRADDVPTGKISPDRFGMACERERRREEAENARKWVRSG